MIGTFDGLADDATTAVSSVTFRVNHTATAVTLTKLSGDVAAAPNTGLQKQNTQSIYALFILAALLLVGAKHFYKKADKTKAIDKI